MARAIASTTQVAYIAEVTDGVVPAVPAFNLVRMTGEGLEIMRKLVYSSELNGRRGEKNYALAGKSGGGSFNFEFTDGTLEDFIAAALRSTWAADVVTDGNTPVPFTLETRFETGGTDVFKRLSGAQVNTLSLNARAQEITTGEIGFVARIADFMNAAVGGATYVAGNAEPILPGNHVGAITLAGLTVDAVHTVTLSINNNIKPRLALGQLEAIELPAGKVEVTGTIGLYLADTEFDILSAFQAGTATGLTFEVGNAIGKRTRFEIPNIVLEAPKPSAESAEGDVLLNLNFRALQAPAISNSVIRVTRNL